MLERKDPVDSIVPKRILILIVSCLLSARSSTSNDFRHSEVIELQRRIVLMFLGICPEK